MTNRKPLLTPPLVSSTTPTKTQLHSVPELRDEASSTIGRQGRKNPRLDEPHDSKAGLSTKTRGQAGAALESLGESARKLSEISSREGVQGPPATFHDVLKAMDTLNASLPDKTKT